ncbi:phosphoribosyl-AMP cyclohydrolase [Brackiella oedipodis]|uniref:phosphoribosyl-AMP cyclohydrolase n=1 Tax=Brackiella oedipodis TaxID=124225 RepID=UPI00048B7AAF|nr:phosphoribosyl-AMP cyclohydrolase [Brackiella oedipodis]
MDWLREVNFNEQGLIPVVAQDAASGRLLMVAWMNHEALQLTVKTKQVVYWSRSRKKLWKKGEQSGHIQRLHSIHLDCDADVLLVKVEQVGGAACHTGRESCFFRELQEVQGQLSWQITDDVLVDPKELYS